MFEKAKPVWLKNRENEVHLRLELKEIFTYREGEYLMKIATSGVYRLLVNGRFVSYGPARAGKGYFRLDTVRLDRYLSTGTNTVIIEVCGYNSTAFSIQCQPSFIQAEITCNGKPIRWSGDHFTARVNPYYVRKVSRYSFQRPMLECYDFHTTANQDPFYLDPYFRGEPLCVTDAKKIIERGSPYPEFERSGALPIFRGNAKYIPDADILYDRAKTDVGSLLTGFTVDELESNPAGECQHYEYIPNDIPISGTISEGEYEVYKMRHNSAGFIRVKLFCRTDVTLYILWDEILSEGRRVNFMRCGDTCNASRVDLCVGHHEFVFLEPYVMQYLLLHAAKGNCTIEDVGMIEYKHPPVEYARSSNDPELGLIADTAVETFRQNVIDIFMDCPSRERAGWLCDGFFMGRTEHFLTGKNEVEHDFLENFLHEESYEALPDGMIPGVYPADCRNGMYLPTWAMWFVLQLKAYTDETADTSLCDSFRNKVGRLLDFFKGYENSDGLLEKLDNWIFVEWSGANDLVLDVNYPVNMLYFATLEAAGALYGDGSLVKKAAELKKKILEKSFNGEYFTDRAKYTENGCVNTGEISEAAQYYAFYFGIAHPESHPELFKKLVENFGPCGVENAKAAGLIPSAPFMGYQMRLELLKRIGDTERIHRDVKAMCGPMQKLTGTFWEHANCSHSCSHGFMSNVIRYI